MSRRQFDDYDREEWEEKQSRENERKQRRDKRRQASDAPGDSRPEDESGPGRRR